MRRTLVAAAAVPSPRLIPSSNVGPRIRYQSRTAYLPEPSHCSLLLLGMGIKPSTAECQIERRGSWRPPPTMSQRSRERLSQPPVMLLLPYEVAAARGPWQTSLPRFHPASLSAERGFEFEHRHLRRVMGGVAPARASIAREHDEMMGAETGAQQLLDLASHDTPQGEFPKD